MKNRITDTMFRCEDKLAPGAFLHHEAVGRVRHGARGHQTEPVCLTTAETRVLSQGSGPARVPRLSTVEQ